MKKAFTLIELIFTIVIIGVLASVAIPKFKGLSDNSKIASELSTASSVQIAIEACHGEWVINEDNFECGNINSSSTDFDSATGYPTDLGYTLNKILKNEASDWERDSSDNTKYYGPASKSISGVPSGNCKDKKPCIGKYWKYNSSNGTFTLIE
jgi:prepilin-type N-terminal cleavage/methylation domain-containing protein